MRSYASSKGSHTLACGVGGPMKLAALILAACLVTACTSGPGDAASPSATLVVPAPGEPLTMACARFGSAPVTDLAGIIGSADPKLRNRGLANISDTVADIASEVERATSVAPPEQIGALDPDYVEELRARLLAEDHHNRANEREAAKARANTDADV